MAEQDCTCGCGRYGNCSWAPYYTGEVDTPEAWEAGTFNFQTMPDVVLLGLGDSYDDRQIDAVLNELIRLRRLERERG